MPAKSTSKLPPITSDRRVVIVGKTGSGKTLLTGVLLANARRLLVVDSKDGLQDWQLEDYGSRSLDAIKASGAYRIRVVQDEQALEAMAVLYTVGNGTVYVDELTAIVRPGKNAPAVFNDIWSRGRSRNIGAWVGIQRPNRVPLELLSEAEHFFIFRLSLERDRERMAEIVGKGALTPVKDKYGFYYANTDDDIFRYYPRLKI